MRASPILLAALLLLPVASAAADVRENAYCHVPPAPVGCVTATLAGTLVGCDGTACEAEFTLSLRVEDPAAVCGWAGTNVTGSTSGCYGSPAPSATGTVSFTQGETIRVSGWVCFAVATARCATYQENFTF